MFSHVKYNIPALEKQQVKNSHTGTKIFRLLTGEMCESEKLL